MKKIFMMLLTFILIFTSLLPSYTVYSEETENYCENMAFSIQTIKVDNEVIEGKAEPESEIELEMENYEDELIVDGEGSFTFELEEKLEVGNEILLTNEQHRIESEIKEVDEAIEMIESELEGECEIPEELFSEAEKTSSEEPLEDNIDDAISSEETNKEAVAEKNNETVTEETESIDSEKEPSLETDEVETAEDVSEASVKESGEGEKEEVIEETESIESDQKPSLETDEVETAEDVSEASVKESREGEKEEVIEETHSIETEEESSLESDEVETAEDVSEASVKESREGEKEEVIEETESIESDEEDISKDSVKESREDEKEEETEELFENNEEKLLDEITDEKNISHKDEIRRQSKLSIQQNKDSTTRVSNREEFNKALAENSIEVIILEENINSSGTINVNSSSNKKIIEANGKSINMGDGHLLIGNSIEDFYVRNASNLYTTNDDENVGFFRKRTNSVNLYLENIAFNKDNNLNGGKLGSNWEGEIHFYGDNIVNTQNGNNSLAFRKVIVHENASLRLTHKNEGSALVFNNNLRRYGDYGLEVRSNAYLEIISDSNVVKTDSRAIENLTGNEFNFTFNEGSYVSLIGKGDYIIDLDSDLDVQITNPETIIFQNDLNNRLFKERRWNWFLIIPILISTNVTFEVHQANIYNGDEEFSSQRYINDGEFTFKLNNTEVSYLKPEKPEDFDEVFLPTTSFLKFDNSVEHAINLEVQEEIFDTDREITGKVDSNAIVKLFDEENNEIEENIEVKANGEFTVTLEEAFPVSKILKFKAFHLHRESVPIERIVIGDRLEFSSEPNQMNFGIHQKNIGKRIIDRDDEVWSIGIKNTRKHTGWKLNVQAPYPLTDKHGNSLDSSLVYKKTENSDPVNLKQSETIAISSEFEDTDETVVSWGQKEGILLEVDPLLAEPDTEYSTTIEWTLTDGP